jgi:HTH-type transcriptional regulator / antitoxin MqsA
MTEKCFYCQGTLEEKKIDRVQQYQSRWVLIENVPALVCKQCGEMYFKPETHDLVLRLVQSTESPTRIEKLDVIDASKAS